MLFYILLIIIAGALIFFLPRIPFIKNSGLKTTTLYFMIAVKILIAIAFASYYLQLNHGSDYTFANKLGMDDYHTMVTDPALFFSDFGQNNYPTAGDFLGAENSIWDDFSMNIVTKILAIFNILTRGNFLVNSVLFSIFGFFGSIGLYHFLKKEGKNNIAAIICCFILPSSIIYTSGIHKDSLIFFSLGIFVFNLARIIQNKKNISAYIGLMLAWLLILLMRNYVALILIPATTAFYISAISTIKPLKVFGIMILGGVLLFFKLTFLLPNYNPVTVIAKRQQSFLKMEMAHSQIPIDTLNNKIGTLIKAVPRATFNAFTKPYPGEFENILFSFFGVEMFAYLTIIVIGAVMWFREKSLSLNSKTLFSLFVSICILIIIGLVTPNAGTIIRYRSLYLPFLIYPFLHQILKRIIFKNI